MRKVGIIGCGNIATIITGHDLGVEIVALFDKKPKQSAALSERVPGAQVCRTFEDFLAVDMDMVVEAASVAAVENYAEAILQSARDLVVLSVGGLVEVEFRERLETLALERESRIHIPTGALFGLDNLRIGEVSQLDRVLLRTTKSPGALQTEVTDKTLLFSGKARECIRRFPKNVNVAVALELASGREVEVELWADPDITCNQHEIVAEGEFGQVSITVENLPSPDNPATSYLAALSIITLLRNMDRPLQIGS